MKRKKQLLVLLLASSMIFSNIFLAFNNVEAASGISVVLDGRKLEFEVPPQIINERTMVPLRGIGEAMGAVVGWEDSTKEISMTLHGKYIKLYIGSNIMIYGGFTSGSNEKSIVYTSQDTYLLEAPPVIVDSRTLVPARAIFEGLGGIVVWNEPTSTVIITSPLAPTVQPTPTAKPTATPSPTPVPISSIIEDSAWFRTISGTRAQRMYDDNEQFILVYYSSEDDELASYLPLIKEVAEDQGCTVYGVDSVVDDYNSSRFTFIWDHYSSSKRRATLPLIFFVNGQNDVDYIAQPKSKTVLNSRFTDFIDVIFYTPKPTAYAGTTPTPSPTPRPTPSPTPNIDLYWNEINRAKADSMYNNGQKFIYVYYHSNDDDSNRLISIVKQASLLSGIDVYATDVAQYGLSDTEKWWGNTGGDYMLYPTVYFVNGIGNVNVQEQPENVNTLANTMSVFAGF